MDSFIETFHIDWKIIIAQAINFVVILGVLYFLALKPLKKIMRDRSSKIEKGLNDATLNAELLDKTQREYDAILVKARAESNKIFQDGKKEADNKKSEMLELAKEDVNKMIENGKKTLEGEKIKMIEEAKKEVVSLVVKATEKLLESNTTESFNNKSIEKIKNL